MAEIAVLTSIENAARIKVLLDAVADQVAGDPDDDRSRDQVRHDALIELITSDTAPGLRDHLIALTRPRTGDTDSDADADGRDGSAAEGADGADDARPSRSDRADRADRAGESDRADETDRAEQADGGDGSHRAEEGDREPEDGTGGSEAGRTDPATTQHAEPTEEPGRDHTGDRTGDDRGGRGGGSPSSDRGGGPCSDRGGGPNGGRSGPSGPKSGAGLDHRRAPVQVVVLIPASTLLGGTAPGYLAGLGPIGAQMARDLARDGDWRCAAVDDEHGTILGLGRRTYRPGYVAGDRLRGLTELTWSTCAFPGCRTRAGQCDFDHVHPYSHGGPTCACNGQPLCRRHHLLKTMGLYDATTMATAQPASGNTDSSGNAAAGTEVASGSVRWTTPTGLRYLNTPPTPTRMTPTAQQGLERAAQRSVERAAQQVVDRQAAHWRHELRHDAQRAATQLQEAERRRNAQTAAEAVRQETERLARLAKPPF
jgi:hypothetical protein